MPVRSLSSSVLKWPDRATVDQAVRRWASSQGELRPHLLRLGYFGSYARGDWGVGSDLDLVAVVRTSTEPFERRTVSWDTRPLPVPVELLVYTDAEWRRLIGEGSRFARTLASETVWVFTRGGS